MSYDEGVTWPVSKVIYEGLSGYSSLTILNDGTIGCAYENGEFEEYQIYLSGSHSIGSPMVKTVINALMIF